MIHRPHLMGILNVTPDSFSDGGLYTDPSKALDHAFSLVSAGANSIDIGGDSTRPGSECVGPETEWERIKDLIPAVAKKTVVSVDTHFASTAEKAFKAGAQIINDISGGSDPDMFRIVAKASGKIVVMYSRCSAPHHFDLRQPQDLLIAIKDFFNERIQIAEKAGVHRSQILFDPGMGGFLSAEPKDSFELLCSLDALSGFTPLLLGISRKGFLKEISSSIPEERDPVSSYIAAHTAYRFPELAQTMIIRTHNVEMQDKFFRTLALLGRSYGK